MKLLSTTTWLVLAKEFSPTVKEFNKGRFLRMSWGMFFKEFFPMVIDSKTILFWIANSPIMSLQRLSLMVIVFQVLILMFNNSQSSSVVTSREELHPLFFIHCSKGELSNYKSIFKVQTRIGKEFSIVESTRANNG